MEVVVLVGLQGAGKSTWAKEHLPDHVVVSKDHWLHARHKERRRQRVPAEQLAAGQNVVVDNTNPSAAGRAHLVRTAREAGRDLAAREHRASQSNKPTEHASTGRSRRPA